MSEAPLKGCMGTHTSNKHVISAHLLMEKSNISFQTLINVSLFGGLEKIETKEC